MARRHRGPLHRVGDPRAIGAIVTYLIGADGRTPLVALHATGRSGNGWAELSLIQAGQLIERLRGLLNEAGRGAGGDDD
ncbi:hypothetical protein D7044_29335 [Micromonospora musae]|uniref:Uncharacterized protein n=1 Tax=Micromonospora musae TaxID=1894970 RepID=A0A3A9XQM2_9ACTN|nr:hypothetical protein D7044_29335 [Micromonospora musae]